MTSRLSVALATCAGWPDLDEDGPVLRQALADEGVTTTILAWDDPGVDWSTFDLVLLRTTWDWWDRHEEFLAWTRRVPRLANTAEVVAWNTDKSYLREFERAGIPVVPTTWLVPGDTFSDPGGTFVVKPSVSAGARDTAAYVGGDPAAGAHVDRLLTAGRTVMVQPYLEQVDSLGETAVLVFDGKVSHAAVKAAVLTPGSGTPALGSWQVAPREASAQEVAFALRVVKGRDLLYARVDLLPTADGPVLIELEVTEPSLFLQHSPASATRLARAVRARALRPSALRPSALRPSARRPSAP